jgi:DNA-binding response OmpR family regulator
MTTLIVDDHPDCADSIAMALQFAGLNTVAVTSGQAALNAIAEFEPQAAILDLKIANIDGFEIAKAFRASPLRTVNTATLIAYTGLQSDTYRLQALEAGFDLYILKPCDPEFLCACLGCNRLPGPLQIPVPSIDRAKLTVLSERSKAALQYAQGIMSLYDTLNMRGRPQK